MLVSFRGILGELKFGDNQRSESSFLSLDHNTRYLKSSQYTSKSLPSHLKDCHALSSFLLSPSIPLPDFLPFYRMQVDSPQDHEDAEEGEEEEERQPWELTRAGKRIAELKEIEDVRFFRNLSYFKPGTDFGTKSCRTLPCCSTSLAVPSLHYIRIRCRRSLREKSKREETKTRKGMRYLLFRKVKTKQQILESMLKLTTLP